MFHHPGRRLTVALVLALVGALAVTATALAMTPKQVKPGKSVHRGHIRLVVKDTNGDAKKFGGVFVTINKHKKFDKFHNLKKCSDVKKGCDFLNLKAWKGHPGLWTTTAQFSFPGYWASTPGKYYWQAENVGNGPGNHVTSKIKSFRVT